MKKTALVAALFAVAVLASAFALAEDAQPVTLTGDLMCAHCTLKEEGVTKCQDVLVVGSEGAQEKYYLAKNDVSDKFGHVCKDKKKVTVTGTVQDKDGKHWIEATKIENA
ncbi:MAG: hypothetical protein KBD01_00120 [Acidobacteria bacterium]|nr:hypothetical protein [Acidobacteriota bacterium]